MAAPFATLGVALLLLAVGVVSISGGDRVLGALGFAVLTMLAFRGEGAERDFEEERLREELLVTLGGHRRQ